MSLLKKHWHKFIVASFASFWAGCGSDSESSTQPTYQDTASSANEAVPGSSGAQVSSSNAGGSESTSSNSRVPFPTTSSSSVEAIAEPMYGVVQVVTCEPTLVEEYQSPACQDEICPDYGVEIVQTEGCDCTNGKKYTLKEFGKFFGVEDPTLCDPFSKPSTENQEDGGTESAASESPANSSSSEESTTTSASEDPATSSSSVGINESPFVEGTPFIDQPTVYGPPCYFDGSCATTPVVPTTEEKE